MALNRLNLLRLIIWIVVFEGVGFLLGLITKQNILNWYLQLDRSVLTPPSIVFSIAWTIFYGLLAITGFLLWQERHKSEIKPIFYCFMLQMLMNWLWTPLFFHWHLLGFSFLWISLLTGLVFICIYLAFPKRKDITLLMLPYLLWLFFATYLNGVIWFLN